jgi:hypothetical protein
MRAYDPRACTAFTFLRLHTCSDRTTPLLPDFAQLLVNAQKSSSTSIGNDKRRLRRRFARKCQVTRFQSRCRLPGTNAEPVSDPLVLTSRLIQVALHASQIDRAWSMRSAVSHTSSAPVICPGTPAGQASCRLLKHPAQLLYTGCLAGSTVENECRPGPRQHCHSCRRRRKYLRRRFA